MSRKNRQGLPARALRRRQISGGTLDRPALTQLSDRYVSHLLRLAWLAPHVLERLVVRREPCAISLYDLCFVASLPWEEQPGRVFD